MKVLLAGATGVLGGAVASALQAAGHDVIAVARSAERAQRFTEAGMRLVVADALDRDGLLGAVQGVTADAVIHELTALRKPPIRHSGMKATNRLRIEGTANLLEAAKEVGAKRFITQ